MRKSVSPPQGDMIKSESWERPTYLARKLKGDNRMLVKRIRDQPQGLDAPQVPRPMVKAILPEPQFRLGAKHRPPESD